MRQPACPPPAPLRTPCRNLPPLPNAWSRKARISPRPGSSNREPPPVSVHPGTCNAATIAGQGFPAPCANDHLQLVPIRRLGVVFVIRKRLESQTLRLFVQQGARQIE